MSIYLIEAIIEALYTLNSPPVVFFSPVFVWGLPFGMLDIEVVLGAGGLGWVC